MGHCILELVLGNLQIKKSMLQIMANVIQGMPFKHSSPTVGGKCLIILGFTISHLYGLYFSTPTIFTKIYIDSKVVFMYT